MVQAESSDNVNDSPRCVGQVSPVIEVKTYLGSDDSPSKIIEFLG
jgi:hypothetical protein